MDPGWTILLEVLVLLAAALVLGTLAEQLRQSAILGYLVAGTLVGPNVLGLVESRDDVLLIAELGVALLLFTIGLEFSFRRLRRLGRVALVGGSLQVVITLGIAALAALVLGLGGAAAVAVGALVALSSTACVLRILASRAALDSPAGRGAVGILLLQDLAVIPLTLLMLVLGGDGSTRSPFAAIALTALYGAVLIGLLWLIINFVVPPLLNIRRWAQNRELPILLTFVLALGSAAAAHAAGLSPAMGAFVAGVLLAESPFALQIRSDIGPLRTLLVTLFFASIGMLGEPLWALQHAHQVIGLVIAIVVGKTLVVWGVGRAVGLSHGIAVATGLCVAQVGEFSFVLADLGHGTVIDDHVFRLFVSATIVTLFLTPFLVAAAPRVGGRVERWFGRRPLPLVLAGGEAGSGDGAPAPPDVLIVGFGPAGQAVAESLLGADGPTLAVLELNPHNAKIARRYGLPVVIADATRAEVLEHAGIGGVGTIVITVPDPMSARTIIQQCRGLAPSAAILTRARYHVRRWELELAGAHEVVDEEVQVGTRLAEEVRRRMGPDRADT